MELPQTPIAPRALPDFDPRSQQAQQSAQQQIDHQLLEQFINQVQKNTERIERLERMISAATISSECVGTSIQTTLNWGT